MHLPEGQLVLSMGHGQGCCLQDSLCSGAVMGAQGDPRTFFKATSIFDQHLTK